MKLEPIYRRLGRKIRKLRIRRGITQGDLADRVGLERTSVVNIEAGRQRILLHDVKAFAVALRVQGVTLLNGVI